jgi:hypothetical protein
LVLVEAAVDAVSFTETSDTGVGAATAARAAWGVGSSGVEAADLAGALACAFTYEGAAKRANVAMRRKRRILMGTFLVVLAW